MAVVIDSTNRKISLNVRDLAAETEFARIGLDREGWSSFSIGAQVHEQVLNSRIAADPAYRKEIWVEASVVLDDWTAVISGRMDGCLIKDGAAHIEEFKTASLVPGKAARNHPGFQRHCRQLLIYCDLWTKSGNRVASARLVYVDPDTAQEESVALEFDLSCQAATTEARLRRLLAEWKSKTEARARKAACADTLPFPHGIQRPGQARLISAITDSLETGGHLLAEAPTGLGKTAASLYPALKHALRSGKQLIFLTSKTLQQTLAIQALNTMNRDRVFRAVQLRAKEKMCANDRVFCHEDACVYAKNYPAKMERSGLLEQLATNVHHPPEKIFETARATQVCPFEVQLELAHDANVIVADYNYIFDPGSALMHLRDEGLREAILIVDEAHNLPERIRRIFSPELLSENINAAIAMAKNLEASQPNLTKQKNRKLSAQLAFTGGFLNDFPPTLQLLDALGQMSALLSQCEKSLPAAKPGAAEILLQVPAFLTLWEQWKPAFFSYVNWKQRENMSSENDPLVEFHFALQRFVAVLRMMKNGAPGFATIIERGSTGLRLAALCLDAAIPCAGIFRQAASVIFLSATLQPFDLFCRTLGLEKSRVSEIALASPFPPENRRVLIVPGVRTHFAAREQAIPKIAALIAEMDAAHDGNKLVLMPSYELLRRLIGPVLKISETSGNFRLPTAERLKVQSPNATDKERRALLQALGAPPAGGILLFAVLGGMFAEGVDYPGELLETVVIVSPGLPQVSFERELLRRHFDERDGNGFEYAYLQPGMTRVIQAAGRLIRSETDRGVIVLICGRFLEEPYSARLPRDWYQRTPMELFSEKPGRDIKKFFRSARANKKSRLPAHLMSRFE